MAIPEDVVAYMRAHSHHGPGAAMRNRQVMREAWARHKGTARNPDTGQIVKVGLFLTLGYLALKALGILKPGDTATSPDGKSTVTANLTLS